MKQCGRCKESKPLSEYNKDKYTKSGYRSQCKECMSKERDKMKDYYKQWREQEEIKEIYRKYRKERYFLNKKKSDARNKARVLTSPDKCEKCLIIAKVQAHHDDYDKPLDVRWLCPLCHTAWHKENGEGKNGF
jgi:hypothetical protein